MSIKHLVALVALLMFASIASAQQPQPRPAPPKGPKPTAADVQRVVASITADKAKVQIYCDLAKLDEQMMIASQKKDNKTLQTLGKKMADMEQKLGPDYANLMDAMQQIEPDSADAKQLTAPFEALDKQCTR